MNLKSKSFSLGSSIVIPEKGVRYVYYSKGIYKLFHNNLVFCGNRDTKGFCIGHDIKRKEFIKKYCNGIVPKQMEIDSIIPDIPRNFKWRMSDEECLGKFKHYKELRAAGLNQKNVFERLDIRQNSASSFVQRGRRLLRKEETRKEVKKK